MEEKLISIIIPMYNASLYIEKCLDSIINQTYQNLEIIVVDDGSTDGCDEIVDAYVKLDSRLSLVKQNNMGQSAARNNALKVARGEYYYFADSDDYLDTTIIQKLYKACEENNVPIAMCDFNRVVKGKCIPFKHTLEAHKVIDLMTTMNYLAKNIVIENFLWNKLFRAELWKDLTFPVGRLYEDFSIMHILFYRAQKSIYVDECLYNYVYREKSSVHNQFIGKELTDSLDARVERFHFISEFCPAFKFEAYKSLVLLVSQMYKKCIRYGALKEYSPILRSYEKKHIDKSMNKSVKDFNLYIFLNFRALYILFYEILYLAYKPARFVIAKLRN